VDAIWGRRIVDILCGGRRCGLWRRISIISAGGRLLSGFITIDAVPPATDSPKKSLRNFMVDSCPVFRNCEETEKKHTSTTIL
jgi:hypothetical protein